MAGDRLDDLMLRVKAIQGRVSAAPALRWGTVTATSPLSVLLDGAPDAFVGVSNAGPRALVVGQRVRVDVQGTRVTVVSAARDDLRGTSAQRVALGLSGVMQDGMKFFDTDDKREYIWLSGGWAGLTPLHGTLTFGSSSGVTLRETVTFPSGYFQTAPAFHVTPISSAPGGINSWIHVSSTIVTANSADVLFTRSTATSANVNWSAFPRL